MAVTKPTPRKTTNAKQDTAGRRVKTKGEAPRADLADKTITPTMERFAVYIEEQTGVKVDPQSVQLGSALRGAFQKSDENQQAIADRKVEMEREAEERAQRKADRIAKREEREAARAARAEERANSPKAEAKPKAKPVAKTAAAKPAPAAKATPAKKPVAKTVAAKPAAKTRRPAKPAVADDTEF